MNLDSDARDMIRRILSPFADRIDEVVVFGSRATGRARPNSDIDLSIAGDLTDSEVDRLWTLFEDSALPVTVDVISYSSCLYAPLKAHIDSCGLRLFTRSDLQSSFDRRMSGRPGTLAT